eukprot:1088345-Prorocentrum_minimum.AAC.1
MVHSPGGQHPRGAPPWGPHPFIHPFSNPAARRCARLDGSVRVHFELLRPGGLAAPQPGVGVWRRGHRHRRRRGGDPRPRTGDDRKHVSLN